MVDDLNPWSSQDLVGDDLTASLSELAPLDFSNIHFQDDLFTVDKTEIAEAHEGDTTITDKAGGTEEQVIRAEGDTMDTGSETTDIKEIATETDDIEVDLSPAKRHKKDSKQYGAVCLVSRDDGPTLCRSLLPLSDLDKINETLHKLGLETERHTHNIDIFNTLLNIHSWIVKVSQQFYKLGLDTSLPILPFLSNLTASSNEETATDITPPTLAGRNRPPLTLADLESPEGYQDSPINLNSKHDQKHAARPEQLSRRIDRHTQGQHQQEPKLHDMWAQHVGFPVFGAQVAPSEHEQWTQRLYPREACDGGLAHRDQDQPC
ncbi:hypothetical protein KI688_003116 [Linnemannia hyalina]|uniref:Uncharacterized protein n=1 Tax=Linnemannia hyalina TaxID=64524 RepID=A0A9P8BQW7_9FUNG|nr:hypothetical protein KI688_003116 [Linnemannia hyalina]